MKTIVSHLRICALVLLIVSIGHVAAAATFTWTGASGTDLLWSTPANWSPVGPPGPADEARFFEAGATNDATSISSIVAGNLAIERLWVGPTNGLVDGSIIATHHFMINAGVTLTIAGTAHNGSGPLGSKVPPDPNPLSTFFVGTKRYIDPATPAVTVTNIISGEGTLVLNNTNNELNVRQGHSTGTGQFAVLDMAGLNSFSANLGRIRIGDGEAEPQRRMKGVVRLARTNQITLSGPSVADDVQLVIGNNDVNNPGNGGASFLILGQKNTLNIDHILVGARKNQGNILFNNSFTDASLRLRGTDSVGRVKALRIGDESDQNASGNPATGTINLMNGTVDLMADRVVVGKHQTGGGQAATGFLTLGHGTLDANTLIVADQTDAQAASATSGTVTVSNTTVRVNDLLHLGIAKGGPAAVNATLNIIGGSVSVGSNYLNSGTVTINVTDGFLSLPPAAKISASTIAVNNGAISNVAGLKVTNSLTLGAGAVISGDPAFDMGVTAAALWDVSALPALQVIRSFSGIGSVSGNVNLAADADLVPGGTGRGGTLNFANLTLNNSDILLDLSTNVTDGATDVIAVSGALTLTGTNDVVLNNLGVSLDLVPGNNYTVITYGTLSGSAANLRPAGILAKSRYTFAFDSVTAPNAILLDVGGTGGIGLTWSGGGANNWDFTSSNWNNGTAQFFNLDFVRFDDTGSASPAINLVETMAPGSMVVGNATKNYTFSGPGDVVSSALTKEGAGSLTFNNDGDNSFSTSVTISNGAVTFSNTGTNTFNQGLAIFGGSVTLAGTSANIFGDAGQSALTIGTGASLTVANTNENTFSPVPVTLNGTLTFNQAIEATLPGNISGAGTLTKQGAGRLTLSGDNSGLSTVVQINGGTIRAGTATSLGSVGATVASGGQLDLNGQNLSAVAITAAGQGPAGQGAIISSAGLNGTLGTVTLTGNTTFGGAGAWNTDPVLNVGLVAINSALGTGGQPFNLTKVGMNELRIGAATVDAALGDIDVQQGLLDFRGGDSMGNPARTLTVRAGATLAFFDTATSWDKRIELFGDGVTPSIFNYQGTHTVVGPITLNGSCVIADAPPDRGDAALLTLSGPLSGTGGLIRAGVISDVTFASVPLVLSGTNTYTGDTLVSGGTLALSGEGSISASPNITVAANAILETTARTDGTLRLANGQTLRGNGTVNGFVVAGPGSTVSPGVSIGALTVLSNVTLAGVTIMELDKSAGTNDVLRSGGSITYGGTLSLANLAGALAANDSFKLFDATSYSGAFTNVVPATPGAGLAWDTSLLTTSGTLKITGGAAPPHIGSIRVSGGNAVITGTGGSAGGAYYVRASSNIALPVANWPRVATNNFDAGGNFTYTNAIGSGTQTFFLIELP